MDSPSKLATLEGREVVKGFLSKKQVSDFTGGLAAAAIYGTAGGVFEGRYYGDLLRDKSTGEILGMHGKGSFRGDPESTEPYSVIIGEWSVFEFSVNGKPILMTMPFGQQLYSNNYEEGAFIDGKLVCDKGVKRGPNYLYIGEFKDGVPHGYGTKYGLHFGLTFVSWYSLAAHEFCPDAYNAFIPGIWCKQEGNFKPEPGGSIIGPLLHGNGKYETILHHDFFKNVPAPLMKKMFPLVENAWNRFWSPIRSYEGMFKDGKMVEREKAVFWKHSDNFGYLYPRFEPPALDPFILPDHVGEVDELEESGTVKYIYGEDIPIKKLNPQANPFSISPDSMLLSGYYDISSEGHTLGAHGAGSYIADGGWVRQMGEMKPPNILHGKGIRFLAYTEGFKLNNMWAGPVTILDYNPQEPLNSEDPGQTMLMKGVMAVESVGKVSELRQATVFRRNAKEAEGGDSRYEGSVETTSLMGLIQPHGDGLLSIILKEATKIESVGLCRFVHGILDMLFAELLQWLNYYYIAGTPEKEYRTNYRGSTTNLFQAKCYATNTGLKYVSDRSSFLPPVVRDYDSGVPYHVGVVSMYAYSQKV